MCDISEEDMEIMLISSIIEETEEINIIHTILSFYSKFKSNKTFWNTLNSFFTNVFEKDGIEIFINHMKNVFVEKQEECNLLMTIFKEWLDFNNDDNKIQNCIAKLNNIDKIKFQDFVRYFYFSIFDKINFKKYSHYSTGIDHQIYGFFSPLFNKKITKFVSPHLNNFDNVDVHELIELIKPYLNNLNISNIIDYIHEILCNNEDLTRSNVRFMNFEKLSTISFNKFLLMLLLEIYSNIGLKNIIDKIQSEEFKSVKEYNITDLSLEQKLIVTTAKAIPICHVGAITLYHYNNDLLRTQKRLFGYGNSKKTEIMENKVLSLSSIFSYDKSNNMLQNFYIDYYSNLHTKFKIDEIFMDILFFTDLITSFPPEKNIYGFVSPKLFQTCSEILGNSELTKHTRQYGAEVLFKLVPTHGFDIAPTFFNDLFKYIADIDYYKWMNLLQAIKHHKKILQNMIMLLDYPKKVFEQSDIVISKTLYTLLGNAIENYTQFESICEKSKDEPMHFELMTIFNDFFDIVMMTLNVYTNIYSQAIVKKSYSETEEKYSILVHKLIESCTSEKSVINKNLKNDVLTKQLLQITYKSLFDHIDMSAKHLAQYKDLIINGFDKSNLSQEETDTIKKSLEANFKYEITYPDEFLDPLLCTPIVEPIMLPGINEIHDRIAIVSQIHESGKNPYNREPLTIEQLDEYNNKPEIANKIKQFLEKKKQFEMSINI